MSILSSNLRRYIGCYCHILLMESLHLCFQTVSHQVLPMAKLCWPVILHPFRFFSNIRFIAISLYLKRLLFPSFKGLKHTFTQLFSHSLNFSYFRAPQLRLESHRTPLLQFWIAPVDQDTVDIN